MFGQIELVWSPATVICKKKHTMSLVFHYQKNQNYPTYHRETSRPTVNRNLGHILSIFTKKLGTPFP